MASILPTRIFPIGIQSFEQLRTNHYVYVDKTRLVYQLANTSRISFLSRPRRFGKSLLLSTLKAYFEGKKHLFEGLAIEELEREWTVYPVLHLSFARTRYTEVRDLEGLLNIQLLEWEKLYGHEPSESTYTERFDGIIRRASQQTGREVVILIDEYDSPILDSTNSQELQKALRLIMRGFFSPLKDNVERIRFLFITGITKFSQMSIFSELNNLDDISMEDDYAAICGITETELFTELKEDIQALARRRDETYEEACAHLKRMYDGYHFTDLSEDIYNPFSIINVLKKKAYGSYWYATGTPTFLIELLRERNIEIPDLEHCKTSGAAFDQSTDTLTDPLPVLYQSGYLTIKSYKNGTYILGFPNDEVRHGFLYSLLPSITGSSAIENNISITAMQEALDAGDVEKCLARMRSFVASIPYENYKEVNDESRFESIFYILFTLMGQAVHTQVKTSAGRADAIVTTTEYIYVFEFKVDSSPEEALAQIDKKGYAIPYEADGRKVVKVGVN
ncbi:MAG: ATP-binding protein, partial [Mediterranea sp.]|nr:ATP-binding protein [Mediterranea sp.]